MIRIVKANAEHVDGISKVCSDSYYETYKEIYSDNYIKGIVKKFYNKERILKEVSETRKEWGGYFVALEKDEVVGAGGGGMTDDTTGEVFVLYLKPARRSEGIGTLLLAAITKQQKEEFNANKQWVSVAKSNLKAIPFYEARGFKYRYETSGYGNVDGERYTTLRYYREI